MTDDILTSGEFIMDSVLTERLGIPLATLQGLAASRLVEAIHIPGYPGYVLNVASVEAYLKALVVPAIDIASNQRAVRLQEIQRFIKDKLVADEGHTAVVTIYAAYREWAEANNIKPVTCKFLTRNLSHFGYRTSTAGGLTYKHGIRVNTPPLGPYVSVFAQTPAEPAPPARA